MEKNGNLLILTIDRDDLVSGIWDPYYYREDYRIEKLSDYVDIKKLKGKRNNLSHFEPIEYRHVQRGGYLTFHLQRNPKADSKSYQFVGEQALLFGTMRAYIGNVIITPKADWIGEKSPLLFPINAEFVKIVPEDGLIYFWWALLQSPSFLSLLPAGSGGTRPRTTPEIFAKTPVKVPSFRQREDIHEKLQKLAECDWGTYIKKETIVSWLQENQYGGYM